MTSVINRYQELVDGVIIVKIKLVSQDAGDQALIEKFGDIQINPTGTFTDPSDGTFPAFYVSAGPVVNFYTAGEIKTIFKSNTLQLASLQRQANLWGNAMATAITNAMTSLRALSDTTTLNTQVTI